MLNEINRDYYENMKKSILNYVLKDDEEKQRVGIMEIIDEVLDYGEGVYKGVEPTQEWKESVSSYKEFIHNNLVINCKATMQIMNQWHSKYNKMTMIVLPKKKDHPMSI